MGINFVEEGENLSDNELISRISEGAYENLRVLIDRYMPYIIKKANGFKNSGCEVEDLIAEGVLAIFTAVKSYDSKKAKFSTFVTVCISRAMSAQVKAASAVKRIPDSLISPIEDAQAVSENSPEDIYIDKENYQALKNSLFSSLSDMEYRVLILFLSGKSYSQISSELGISVKSVGNSLQRIRSKIRK